MIAAPLLRGGSTRTVRSTASGTLGLILACALSWMLPPAVRGQDRPEADDDASAQQAGGAPGDEQLPSLKAVPLEGALDLDGSLDEAAWERAPVATGFVA